MQSCCFANINQFRCCHSRCGRRRRWLSFLMSDWPPLRSYMMISFERVWMVVPFEQNIFRQRWVCDWDQPHYQKWRLSQHVNYRDFWETGPCSESFQLAPVWTQWIKAPHGSPRWGHVDLADVCSQRSQKVDVPNEFVEPNLYSRWVPECFFFCTRRDTPGLVAHQSLEQQGCNLKAFRVGHFNETGCCAWKLSFSQKTLFLSFRLSLTEQQIRVKMEFSLLLIKQFPSLVISSCTKKLLKLLRIYRG